jgi:hypothetical protein
MYNTTHCQHLEDKQNFHWCENLKSHYMEWFSELWKNNVYKSDKQLGGILVNLVDMESLCLMKSSTLVFIWWLVQIPATEVIH